MRKNNQGRSCFCPDRGLCPLSGFTLIELIIVVTIISILATIGLVKYSGVAEKGRSAEAYVVLSDIAAAVNAYYTENDVYPTAFNQLDRYTAAPTSDNFNFTIQATYGKAEKKEGRGTQDYCLNFNGTKKLPCP